MEIKVLGTGCTKCKKLEAATRETVEEMGIDATIEKIEDMYKIMSFGVMSTPGLVIDGKVVMTGKLPDKKEIKTLIEANK